MILPRWKVRTTQVAFSYLSIKTLVVQSCNSWAPPSWRTVSDPAYALRLLNFRTSKSWLALSRMLLQTKTPSLITTLPMKVLIIDANHQESQLHTALMLEVDQDTLATSMLKMMVAMRSLATQAPLESFFSRRLLDLMRSVLFKRCLSKSKVLILLAQTRREIALRLHRIVQRRPTLTTLNY